MINKRVVIKDSILFQKQKGFIREFDVTYDLPYGIQLDGREESDLFYFNALEFEVIE